MQSLEDDTSIISGSVISESTTAPPPARRQHAAQPVPEDDEEAITMDGSISGSIELEGDGDGGLPPPPPPPQLEEGEGTIGWVDPVPTQPDQPSNRNEDQNDKLQKEKSMTPAYAPLLLPPSPQPDLNPIPFNLPPSLSSAVATGEKDADLDQGNTDAARSFARVEVEGEPVHIPPPRVVTKAKLDSHLPTAKVQNHNMQPSESLSVPGS